MVDVDIWFVCSLQPKRDPTKAVGGVLQLHGQTGIVTIEGIPESEIVDGLPRWGVVWQAEIAFLEQQKARFADHHVVSWEARYGDAGGRVLSRFDVRIASNMN